MRILKVIGLLLEYPDELLWENRDDALAHILLKPSIVERGSVRPL